MRLYSTQTSTTAGLMVSNQGRKRSRAVTGEEEIDTKCFGEAFPSSKRVRFARSKVQSLPKRRTLMASHGINCNQMDDVKCSNTDSDQQAKKGKEKRCSFSNLEKQQLWWTRQERTSMTAKARQMVKAFRKHHKDDVQHYLDVYDHCTQTPSQSSSDYLEQAKIVIPANVRGLEWGILPSLKAHRRVHVQEILDVQKQIKGRLSAEMRYRVLSARSIRSSRPCRVMARLMGEGDATSMVAAAPSSDDKGACKGVPFSSSSARVTRNIQPRIS